MKIRAYAKINLALDVVSEREDGYHELNMIMAPIVLHDLILIDPIEKGIEITTNTYRVPTDERNIMYKVADALIKKFDIQSGVRIHCYKHIPSQAGMGGGSADGAAIFRAMNSLFHLRMSYQDMCEMGKEIGADIPFCVWNRIAFFIRWMYISVLPLDVTPCSKTTFFLLNCFCMLSSAACCAGLRGCMRSG